MALRKFSRFQLALQEPVTYFTRSVLSLPLMLPIDVATRGARQVARGFAVSRINRKKFPRAIHNLRDAYPDWDEERVHQTALAAYEHLFQLGIEILYAPRLLTEDGYARHIDMRSLRAACAHLIDLAGAGRGTLLISGHVGNWELIGYTVSMLGFPMHAVYRPLDLKPLDRWVRSTRERHGMSLVSKFGAMKELPPLLQAGHTAGFVADQNGGDRGMFVPFFGRLTSTYKSIGLLAMQYRAPLICGFARRLRPDEPDPDADARIPPAGRNGPASMRYRSEVTDIINPEDWEGRPDPLFYLTARYRRAMEKMVRMAPEQYLWMHRIWRSRPAHERQGKPFPAALRAKLAELPWMTAEELERIEERSRRDTMSATG